MCNDLRQQLRRDFYHYKRELVDMYKPSYLTQNADSDDDFTYTIYKLYKSLYVGKLDLYHNGGFYLSIEIKPKEGRFPIQLFTIVKEDSNNLTYSDVFSAFMSLFNILAYSTEIKKKVGWR